MPTFTKLIEELDKLSAEGGWIFWGLIALAFGIVATLISIAHAVLSREPEFSAADSTERTTRRIRFAFVLIGAAPLIGLLGTVSGMLKTFGGLATSHASAPVDVISRGISEALITTQTGLVIAIPTFVICTLLKAKHEGRKNPTTLSHA